MTKKIEKEVPSTSECKATLNAIADALCNWRQMETADHCSNVGHGRFIVA